MQKWWNWPPELFKYGNYLQNSLMICDLWRFDNFDIMGLIQPILFLWDYLNKDSKWLILACIMTVYNCWRDFKK